MRASLNPVTTVAGPYAVLSAMIWTKTTHFFVAVVLKLNQVN